MIHEFDPWFNMRATQYLADNGSEKFFKWYDHESWYPLGRPVGTTIYPGMQFTAVYLWKILKADFWVKTFGVNPAMSLNDVCVFIPAWFGSMATVTTGLLTREVSGSWRAGALAALVMAIIPAHLMRSIGGGYDNESIAMFAMVATFFLWCRSLRTSSSWWIGVLAGLAYGYMVAAWGGFIFVCNMVGLHAAALVALGYYSPSLHKAYSLWYLVGTTCALQVPVVGWSPLQSMEQMGPMLVFFVLQFIAVSDAIAARQGLSWSNWRAMLGFRLRAAAAVGAVAVLLIALVIPTGYFGPLSIRVRSLFIPHTRTGNPLVDSVAEHQPATPEAYSQFLHNAMQLLIPGIVISLFIGAGDAKRQYAGVQVNKWFIMVFTLTVQYFCNKMMRLLILMGPVASILCGVALATTLNWCFHQVGVAVDAVASLADEATGTAKVAPAAAAAAPAATPEKEKSSDKKKATEKKPSVDKAAQAAADEAHVLSLYGPFFKLLIPTWREVEKLYNTPTLKVIRVLLAVAITISTASYARDFYSHCFQYAEHNSQPSLMFKAQLNDGKTVIINDYQEAYWFLRDSTPTDARVLSWWDYGYQIAGIGNRTTLADGNTWNLEHIALIGRILTSPEKKAHELARHVADYVLVWAGRHGDDLGKSPHMARIGSSVFPFICPNDPMCSHFGFYGERKPTPSMAASLLYRLHSHMIEPGVTADTDLWKEVYRSKYGLVRVYQILKVNQKSKAWAADKANRKCDAPGSWYCPGAYPPGLIKAMGGQLPKSHRNIDYNDPNKYVEEK